MKQKGSPVSVNCCLKCRRKLTLTADKLGYRLCADCSYFDAIGVHNIGQYNAWLKR